MNRRALRDELRTRRDAFVIKHKPGFAICAPLQILVNNAKCVTSYIAIGSEVDPESATCLAACLALPRIASRDGIMSFHCWSVGDPLERAAFQFLQPVAEAEAMTPDLVLTPLLGFDRSGARLGQGGGHYDRYFASNPEPLRIGLAWSVQELAVIDTAPWDMPLDAIATERDWIVPHTSRIKS